MEKAQEAKIDGNNKHYQYLSNLILIEYQQQMHRRIKHHTHQSKSSGIKYLKIPIDTSILWNNILLFLTEEQCQKVDNPEDIERCLISRNRAHFSQAQGTPFTTNPLKYLLGKDSFTSFCNLCLFYNTDLNKLPLSSLQKLYLSKIKKHPIHYNLLFIITFPLQI